MMMKKTMPVTRRVAVIETSMAFQLSCRNRRARMITPSAPKAADSEGVAIPNRMKPITIMTMSDIGRILTTNAWIFSEVETVGMS